MKRSLWLPGRDAGAGKTRKVGTFKIHFEGRADRTC